MKASAVVAANCRTEGFRAAFENILYALDVHVWGGAANNTMSDDELAHAIFLHVSSSLHWNLHSTVDWYAFAANKSAEDNSMTTPSTDQSESELRIQVIDLNVIIVCVSLRLCRRRMLLSVNIYGPQSDTNYWLM